MALRARNRSATSFLPLGLICDVRSPAATVSATFNASLMGRVMERVIPMAKPMPSSSENAAAEIITISTSTSRSWARLNS
ncbi:hypothetical protein D9M69_607030 [compost metagenome]